MKPKWHANWRVCLGLQLELKESIHILPEEESCNDFSLPNSLILTAFSLALVNIKVLLGECSLYWHKETHTLFPLTNMVVCHLGTLDLMLKGALHNLPHLSFIWQIGKTRQKTSVVHGHYSWHWQQLDIHFTGHSNLQNTSSKLTHRDSNICQMCALMSYLLNFYVRLPGC